MTQQQYSQTPLSVLDLAVVTEGHTPTDTFRNSLDLARKAESWNFQRYWLAEHHNMASVASSATSVLIGYIANGTTSIRVGSGGIMLPNHAPLVIAEQFGTLASLFPGRIDLGLGRAPGTDQVTAMALRRDRLPVDFVQQIQELSTYLSAQNSGGRVRAIPGEGLDIPIWILGSSTDSAQLAGAFGLPYAFASHFAPALLPEAIDLYHNSFRPSPHLKTPYMMACVNVIAADTDKEAERLSTSFLQLASGIITGERRPLPPPVEQVRGLLDRRVEAAVKQMMHYSFIGGPTKVQQEIQQFLDDTSVNELMIVSHIYDHQARLRSYEILRELQVAGLSKAIAGSRSSLSAA